MLAIMMCDSGLANMEVAHSLSTMSRQMSSSSKSVHNAQEGDGLMDLLMTYSCLVYFLLQCHCHSYDHCVGSIDVNNDVTSSLEF